MHERPNAAATDVAEFLTDLDGGQFDALVSVALSKTAAAVVDAGDKAPQLTLRIAKLDEHKQEMGKELRELVRFAISATMPVLVGEYKPS